MYWRGIQRFAGYPDVSHSSKLAAYALARHYVYSFFWTDQTAAPGSRPLMLGLPESHGQALPSSCQLREDLSARYPKEQFYVTIGSIFHMGRSKPSVTSHVWVTQEGRRQGHARIIDVTAENAGMPVVVAGMYRSLIESGIAYKAERSFIRNDDLLDALEKQEPDVRQRISYFTTPLFAIDQLALERYRQSSQNLHELLGDDVGSVWAAVLQEAHIADQPK